MYEIELDADKVRADLEFMKILEQSGLAPDFQRIVWNSWGWEFGEQSKHHFYDPDNLPDDPVMLGNVNPMFIFRNMPLTSDNWRCLHGACTIPGTNGARILKRLAENVSNMFTLEKEGYVLPFEDNVGLLRNHLNSEKVGWQTGKPMLEVVKADSFTYYKLRYGFDPNRNDWSEKLLDQWMAIDLQWFCKKFENIVRDDFHELNKWIISEYHRLDVSDDELVGLVRSALGDGKPKAAKLIASRIEHPDLREAMKARCV